MGILLYEILEHTFHFVKMEISQILNLLKRRTPCRSAAASAQYQNAPK
jgi:hypothetical protein